MAEWKWWVVSVVLAGAIGMAIVFLRYELNVVQLSGGTITVVRLNRWSGAAEIGALTNQGTVLRGDWLTVGQVRPLTTPNR